MKPTPAQIEAAAKAIAQSDDHHYKPGWYEKLAKAALTAAAEVGDKSNHWNDMHDMLTAASLGKDPTTIERCVQVAEDWGLGRVNQTVKDYPATCAAAIAAAIRALKDES